MKGKGMATCKICGRDFALINEEHYVAREPMKKGAIVALVDNDTEHEYDAFDCPWCGCQYIAQERKVYAEAEEQGECTDGCDEEEYEGECEYCEYDEKLPSDEPCNECNHNQGKHNNFKPKGDAE